MEIEQNANIKKTSLWKNKSHSIILILIIAQLWSFYQIKNINGGLNYLEGKIESISGEVNNNRSDINYIIPIAENGNNYAHSHYSDLNLKKDITLLSNVLQDVILLQGIRFNWISNIQSQPGFNDKSQIGFIAQDVQSLFPELVTIAPNGYLTMEYEKLTPILVEAIKEQQLLIDDLQGRILELELIVK